jgi:release factor glutamine methyltransferase
MRVRDGQADVSPMQAEPLRAVLDEAERVLDAAGVWAPRDDAEALAAHVLGVERADLSRHVLLDASVRATVRRLVALRADRVPLGHITGRARLGGIEVAVGPGVFVPRVHTEPLLAWGLSVVRDRRSPVVVDLCTGSAAIALAVAHARPDAVVHAVDCDPVALEYAYRNAARRAAAGDTPIRLRVGDVADPALFDDLTGTVDLVLANPPNVAEGTALLPEWGEHHPRRAIYAGDDGLAVIRSVVALAARLLRPGGGIAVEQADPPAAPARAVLAGHGAFTDVTDRVDHTGRPRYAAGHRL